MSLDGSILGDVCHCLLGLSNEEHVHVNVGVLLPSPKSPCVTNSLPTFTRASSPSPESPSSKLGGQAPMTTRFGIL
jgi:hypothetical protein